MQLDPAIFAEAPKPKRVCSVTGCGRKYRQNGYCGTHYQRLRRGMPLEAPFRVRRAPDAPRHACSVAGCSKPSRGNTGICDAHYNRKVIRKLANWDATVIKAYRPKAESVEADVRISRSAAEIIAAEAKRLRMDRAELTRHILERWAAGIERRDRFRSEVA
jgi:hypothetical protein